MVKWSAGIAKKIIIHTFKSDSSLVKPNIIFHGFTINQLPVKMTE